MKLVIRDGDTSFAHSRGTVPIDLIDRMQEMSAEFYFFVIETGDDCARLAGGEIDSPEYRDELNGYLATVNYFLKAIWSANDFRLADIPPCDYNARIDAMGLMDYQLSEVARFVDFRLSFGFISEVLDRLNELELYTRVRVLLIVRVVLEAVASKCAC